MRTRVLVVDDSAPMRSLLTRALASDPALEVVGAAADPNEARAMIKALNPDVLTLDVEMPGMDGLAFLEKIMTLRPMPVVMCSTLTMQGADATIEALRLGAVACFAKPTTPDALLAMGPVLTRMVRDAATTTVRRSVAPALVSSAPVARPAVFGRPATRMLAIGSSTGGVEALFQLLSAFPADCPPTVIVQHMPASFTASFARRLNDRVAPDVAEASDGMHLRQGLVIIAPGGDRHLTVRGGVRGTVVLSPGDTIAGHRPSVNAMFASLARHAESVVGIILTGMGEDGAEGLLALRRGGAATFGQSEASCVVYGMPRAAARLGAVGRELPLHGIAPAALNAALNAAQNAGPNAGPDAAVNAAPDAARR
jgi:two-component system, chemotaxis family, protein-glutamate methylesterase/glutaminase